MDSLFREHILDHYRHPRNEGVIPDAHVSFKDENVLCGDVVEMSAQFERGEENIANVKFRGSGCAISQAAASILTEELQRKTVQDVMRMTTDDMLALLGVPVSPPRIKCAVLALKVLQAGIVQWQSHPHRIQSKVAS